MARVAQDVGIHESAILLETAAHSTRQNAEFSAPLLRALHASTILLVTDRLHMPRAQACFKKFGFDVKRASVPVFETGDNNVVMLYWAVREAIAIAVYRSRGWLGSPVLA